MMAARAAALVGLDISQGLADLGEGLVPRNGLVAAAVGAAHRAFQTIGRRGGGGHAIAAGAQGAGRSRVGRVAHDLVDGAIDGVGSIAALFGTGGALRVDRFGRVGRINRRAGRATRERRAGCR